MCTASDGENALQMAREKMPDVVLLDMLLPKMTGPDVLKELKKDPVTAKAVREPALNAGISTES